MGCPPFGSQYQQTLSQEPTNRLTSFRRPERSRRLRFLQSPVQIQLCHTLQHLASTPRWAAAAERSPELTNEETAAIAVAKPDLLKIRPHIRAVLKATAAGQPLPAPAVAALNKASRAAAPHWAQIGPDEQLEEHAQGSAIERLLANYARSAMAIATEGMPSYASAAHHDAECFSTRDDPIMLCSLRSTETRRRPQRTRRPGITSGDNRVRPNGEGHSSGVPGCRRSHCPSSSILPCRYIPGMGRNSSVWMVPPIAVCG